ncbi:hypothetical protein AB0758_48550 [Tolypothrix bouteillei VB521301_2]
MSLLLSLELTQKADTAESGTGCILFMTLLAAFDILYRYTGGGRFRGVLVAAAIAVK